MRLPARTTIAWLLAGFFAVVSAVGEGWHFVPGCGHIVELPHGYAILGLTVAKSNASAPIRYPGAGPRQGDSLPCYGEDECPICRLCAEGKSAAQPAGFCLVLAILHAVPAPPVGLALASARQPFDARAPPTR